MFERLFGDRRSDPALADRVPPGQYVTEKFPVLHYGIVPKIDLATWDFKVYGEVDSPFRFTWDAVQGPAAEAGHDRHPLRHALDQARHPLGGRGDPDDPRARPGAADARPTSSRHAEQGYTANLPLSVLDDDDVLLADTFDGAPLEPEHGYPLRLIVPKRYFWKSAKWIRGLEFLTTTCPASGSATATTTTPTPGRNSASASSRRACRPRVPPDVGPPWLLAGRSLQRFVRWAARLATRTAVIRPVRR